MAGEFWLDDQQWAVIAPLLPTNQPGVHRTDDRRVISGIIHVLRSGCPGGRIVLPATDLNDGL